MFVAWDTRGGTFTDSCRLGNFFSMYRHTCGRILGEQCLDITTRITVLTSLVSVYASVYQSSAPPGAFSSQARQFWVVV